MKRIRADQSLTPYVTRRLDGVPIGEIPINAETLDDVIAFLLRQHYNFDLTIAWAGRLQAVIRIPSKGVRPVVTKFV